MSNLQPPRAGPKMSDRPTFIDLRSQSHGPLGTSSPGLGSPRSLPSPRLHVAGAIPPQMSPLDAFAAQSRALAKQLEASRHKGRRVSRLPPLTTDVLNQGRPNYFRSISADATPTSQSQDDSPGLGIQPEVEAPVNRPVSVHPSIGGAPPQEDAPPMPAMPRLLSPPIDTNDEEDYRGRKPQGHPQEPGYFGGRREMSPPPLDRDQKFPPRLDITPYVMQPRPSVESIRARAQGYRRPNDNSLVISNYDSRALAPPRSPFQQRTPSPRSMSMESSDDDYNSNHGHPPRAFSPHQTVHSDRKLSSSSAMSTSPTSPGGFAPAMNMSHSQKSPSISSEISFGGTRLPRPAFNFSRPLSRASAVSVVLDTPTRPDRSPSRQASSDSQPSFILADDTVHTPVSMYSEGCPDNETGAAPSYVYSRFSLPRGKMLQRNSLIFQGGLQLTAHDNAPPSPPSRPSTSSQIRPSLDPAQRSFDPRSQSSDRVGLRPSTDYGTPSLNSSEATIKPKLERSGFSATDYTAEEHVTKAIQFHEEGALTKSTYHLRLAARQNHPTGMLLYALACRHGWGCRSNQKEGVMWLRKAADSASLEIADDEETTKDGKMVDILERKARKAQFALSIYELGVSHMNGWGIEQDKVLALRCFEIAGSWGDADALAEAGFCYAQGIGCKKNLKKSAQFYRQAEAKGISMIGNSWIYKSKYQDETESTKNATSDHQVSLETQKEKKKHHLFGRNKA